MPAFASHWFNSARKAASPPPSDSATFIDEDHDDTTSSPPSLTFSCGPSSPESTTSLNENSSKMQTSSASPIDIATPTRNSSSSPSSQAQNKANYADQDSRASATIMSGAAMDNGMGRGGGKESFASAKPISMHNPNRNLDARPRRESMANSLVGGMSWGGVSVGSWIRDEYVFLCIFWSMLRQHLLSHIMSQISRTAVPALTSPFVVLSWPAPRPFPTNRPHTIRHPTYRNSRPTS